MSADVKLISENSGGSKDEEEAFAVEEKNARSQVIVTFHQNCIDSFAWLLAP
jgi:hypothetical protein